MCDGVEELIREQGQFRGVHAGELEDVNDLVCGDRVIEHLPEDGIKVAAPAP